MTDILWPKIVGLLITPPGVIIIVGLLGLFLTIWRRTLGAVVVGFALVTLFVMSVPLIGKRLMMQLEAPFHTAVVTPDKPGANVQAIVILGGGRYSDAPEYGGDTVNHYTLERLRYGARLARQTGLPVLVSGGSVFGEDRSEAALMQQTLEREFGIKVKWIEDKSRTTFENAQRTKAVLAEAGIRHVYLVTHAFHMARAQWAFVNAGMDGVPAPMGFTTIDKGDLGPLGYIPNANGLHHSALALRERLGLYCYKRKRDAETAAEAVAKPEPEK
jgi:uncharacterized SAM-binding protein YcdF (DUF218 family)